MVNRTETRYPYRDEHGASVFEKVRVEPGYDGKSKSFYCEREENGKKIRNIDGCKKVLYRLREVIEGISRKEPVFLVEGEKDADKLFELGLIATTAPVTLVWNAEYTESLKDADVIILGDYDKAGLKRINLIAERLAGKTKNLRIVHPLPGLEYSDSHGKDITDWLEMGNTIGQLLDLVVNTHEYIHPQQPRQLRAISVEELFAFELPEREMLLSPFLPRQGLVMIVAKRGVGKTHIALGIAYAVATGGTFLRWSAPNPKRVLYVDGEMPAVLMQERLKMISSMSNLKPDPRFLKLITPDLQDNVMPDLATEEGRNMIEEYIEDYDLVVVDNISCLFRSGSENESDSWQQAQEWALDLRRRGKSILFIHHAGKSGAQRGTSKREDILDSVIILKHPEDYKPQEGARFEVHFDKARHFSGDDASSFQVRLLKENESSRWEISNDPEEELLRKIVGMKIDGKTIAEIMKITGRTKSQVETLIKKAKDRGLLE